MSASFLNGIDLTRTELLNAVIQNLPAAPGSPIEGLVYYDTTLKQFGCYQDTTWIYLGAGVVNAVTRAVNAGGAGELIVAGGANKTISAYTTAGIVKIAAGIVAAAVAGTDYITPAGAEPLTNKTINASNNTISNLTIAMLAANVADTDVALTANSDARFATQKAVKAYIDALLNANDALVFKGGIDCSANPNYPAANAGHVYKVTVAGKIGGASGVDVTAGDTLYCITDSSAAGTHAGVGANWVVVQANVDTATLTTQGIVELATQAEVEAKSDATRAVTPAGLANFTQKKTFSIGDGVATAIVCTHNLNTRDVAVSIRDASTHAEVYADVVRNSVNAVTITFAVAPASNTYLVIIIG